jgi:hypothetical protein
MIPPILVIKLLKTGVSAVKQVKGSITQKDNRDVKLNDKIGAEIIKLARDRQNYIKNNREDEAKLMENNIIKYPPEDIWGAVTFMDSLWSGPAILSDKKRFYNEVKPVIDYLYDILKAQFNLFGHDDYEELKNKYNQKYGLDESYWKIFQ